MSTSGRAMPCVGRQSTPGKESASLLHAFASPQPFLLKRARVSTDCVTRRRRLRRTCAGRSSVRSKQLGNGASVPSASASETVPTAPAVPAPGFVVWGPPGSGKSSLCEVLSHSHGLVHISAGNLLRAHVLYQTDWGILASPYVQKQIPVPDSIVIPMVLARLRQVDVQTKGFLLDAFPRNIEQDAALKEAGFTSMLSIMLHAPREVLESRLRHRRLDPVTDLLYNLRYRPPDSQEVLERLVLLAKDRDRNTAELFATYGRRAGALFDRLSPRAARINANRDIHEVLTDISNALQDEGVSPLRPDDISQFVRSSAPHEVIGGKQGDVVPALNGQTAASASAALRASKNTAKTAANAVQKAALTLIRCDGYMCERESVDRSKIAFRGSATEQVMLVWNEPPTTVLLLVKKDPVLMSSVLDAATYMMNEKNLNVIVEPQVQNQALANGLYLDTFSTPEALPGKVDFVVCLGGDGLILHVSTLFKNSTPPVISFNMGSLGFLTPFKFGDFKSEIEHVLSGECRLSLRMRLTCTIIRNQNVEKEFIVLNEVVVDRGSSPYLSNLDTFVDGKYITTVQADGIIMSTPTGSTAYSMSAGGSMVHPSVPAVLFTPICPHSLSFRPIVFPDSAKITVVIAEDARSHAWASFDGKFRQQLKRGDALLVQMNLYPVPTINKTDNTGDWFQSLDRAFNFNNRARQKPLPNMDLDLVDVQASDEVPAPMKSVAHDAQKPEEGDAALPSKVSAE